MASEKPQFSPDTIEFDHHADDRSVRKTSLLESVRLGLTLLTLCMATGIVGMSGSALAIYNKTHVSRDYLLPLWPFNFNLSPSIALVTGSSIILLSSAISLIGSKVTALRARFLIHTIVSVLAPLAGLIAAIIATSFFYSINTSTTVDTLQSWSCRWSNVVTTNPPHFNTICKESQAALYMMIALIPLELLVLCLAGYSFVANKKPAAEQTKGSPAMS